MPTYYRTPNQTLETEPIDLSGLGWITTTPTTSTQATATYTPSVTTSSSATRVYIDASSPYSNSSYFDDWIDGTREMGTNFYRHPKENSRKEKPRELTDEELVKVLNSGRNSNKLLEFGALYERGSINTLPRTYIKNF